MNGNLAWSDWRFWINWFLFGTFGYGGGMMGWYLCLGMWLLLHVPLAMVTVMVLEGVMAGAWSAPLHGEVVQLNAPQASFTAWTAVTITTMITSYATLLGIIRNKTSRVGKTGKDWHGNGRYPPHTKLTLRRSFMA